MDEETAATASVGFGSGLQSQHAGAVVARIRWRPGDGPVSARDWANVGHVLHSGIVLPRSSTGIAGCDVLAVLLQLAGRLIVGPGKCLEVDWKMLWIRHVLRSGSNSGEFFLGMIPQSIHFRGLGCEVLVLSLQSIRNRGLMGKVFWNKGLGLGLFRSLSF
jgi:hypothetical protein